MSAAAPQSGVAAAAAPFPGIASIELLVADLDAAVALFCDVLGCGPASRHPAELVAGEQALIDVGTMVITLLAAADSGEPAVLADRTPRFTSMALMPSPTVETATRANRAMEAGLIVSAAHDGSVVLPPEGIEGALGWRVGIVLTESSAQAAIASDVGVRNTTEML